MESSLNREHLVHELRKIIVDVPDFPKPGILFKDITPVLANGKVFSQLIDLFSSSIPAEVTKLVGIESRGFIFASAIAHHLKLGFILVRKPGKLPRATLNHTYELEYGEDSLQIHKEDLTENDKVIIVDDVLATGGTALAAEILCKQLGAKVMGHRFLMEINFLKGRQKLTAPVDSILSI